MEKLWQKSACAFNGKVIRVRAAGLAAGGANLTLGIQHFMLTHFMLKVGDARADEYDGSHKIGR
jgi:hypothetical protein